MGMTPFPNGLSSMGVPIIGSGPTIPFTTGKYIFCSSVVGSDGNSGLNKNQPVATVDKALAKCTANKGDVIIVMPGHTETVASVGALTFDVAGVTLVGIGNGSLRPTFTLSATASTIAVTAADTRINNIIITGSIAELVTVFNVTAPSLTLDAVDFDGGATSTIKFLTTSALAKKLTMVNCVHKTTAAVTAVAWWLQLTGCDDAVIANNIFHIVVANNAGAGVLGGLTTESLRIAFLNNRMICLGTSPLVVAPLASSTGTIAYNTVGNSKTNGVGTIAPASCHAFENYETNEVTKSGMLDPITDTNA